MEPSQHVPGAGVDQLRRQYGSSTNLDVRKSIYAYQEPRYDLGALLAGLVPETLRPGVMVDVGCGPGTHTAALAGLGPRLVVGTDLVDGMVATARAAHRADAAWLVSDGSRLPLPDRSVDVVLAAHMLYHLPDPRAGVRELARVLRPGGIALVILNRPEHLAEFRDLLAEACGAAASVAWVGDRCNLDHRSWFEAQFDSVELVRFDGVIRLEEVGPLVAYADSVRDFYEPLLAEPWPVVLDRFRSLAERRLADVGHLEVNTGGGVFACRS